MAFVVTIVHCIDNKSEIITFKILLPPMIANILFGWSTSISNKSDFITFDLCLPMFKLNYEIT